MQEKDGHSLAVLERGARAARNATASLTDLYQNGESRNQNRDRGEKYLKRKTEIEKKIKNTHIRTKLEAVQSDFRCPSWL